MPPAWGPGLWLHRRGACLQCRAHFRADVARLRAFLSHWPAPVRPRFRMAQHKAPTSVTVAPLREKSGVDLWISKYWVHGTLVVLALFAVIVVRHRMRDKEVAQRDDSWQQLNG